MKILYYYWGENSAKDITDTFSELGHHVTIFKFPLANYLADDRFSQALSSELEKKGYDFIFTFNYFPVVSDTAEKHSIKYACWVYDCPHFTLFSKSVSNSCNYIFLFDQNMVSQTLAAGAKNVFHLPLAAHTTRIGRQLNLSPESPQKPEKYLNEISFIGSLYENNMYDKIHFLPEELIGYLDGIMCMQKQLWGIDLITSMMDKKLTSALSDYIKLERDQNMPDMDRLIFADMLQTKITSDERITAINLLTEFFPVALYSGSERSLCPKADYRGYISYNDAMPYVFFQSKINLNITLRSIASGIPLRAIDILSCGGFLLSNFQPELAENFEAGTDYIYYEDFEDMLRKADYYLKHEREREEIARNGYVKICQNLTYTKQIEKLISSITTNDKI